MNIKQRTLGYFALAMLITLVVYVSFLGHQGQKALEASQSLCSLNDVVCSNEPSFTPVNTAQAATIDAEGQYILNATCYTWTGNQTSSGTWPKWGTVAVKRNDSRFKAGDRLFIEQFGETFTIEDTLPAYQPADLDIFWPKGEADCLAWGRQDLIIHKF